MTINSPDDLKQTPAEALRIVKKLSGKYKSRYAVTPRFAPATDPKVMKETAKIAKKNGSFIQTHLSENTGEIAFVLSLYRSMKGFEKVKSYTHIYKQAGVLGPKTIMGHGIYLNNEECKLLAKTKTSIAHCPTSNAPVSEKGLGSGLFDFKKIEKHKIAWALGTDIGGGPYISMFDVMQSFVLQNKKAKNKGATYIKALFRATLAGAKILRQHKTCGNLNKGKWANFLILDQGLEEKNASKKLAISSKACELLLSRILNSVSSREKYDTFVKHTVYQGKFIYSK
jgi:guanine deaminase